ncbi:MAG: YigZ family protein [Cyclobacteriaceae bacterium]
MNEFQTIKAPTKGEYKEKGSKFLAFAFPVQSDQDIREALSSLKKQYHDAQHHCYAYVIGMKTQSYRANDDGEPNHSAGDPILGQIRSYGLTNTLVVVVRYFGGTKLGVGGLIHAYKTATDDALAQARIETIHSKTRFKIVFNYEETSVVERVLADFDIEYENKIFTDQCEYLGLIKDERFEELKQKIRELARPIDFI